MRLRKKALERGRLVKRIWDKATRKFAPLLAALALSSCGTSSSGGRIIVGYELLGAGARRVAEYTDQYLSAGSEEMRADFEAISTFLYLREHPDADPSLTTWEVALPHFRTGSANSPSPSRGRLRWIHRKRLNNSDLDLYSTPYRFRFLGPRFFLRSNMGIMHFPIIDIYQDYLWPLPVSFGASFVGLGYDVDKKRKNWPIFTFRLIRFGLDYPISFGFYANGFISTDASLWGGYGALELTGYLGGARRLFRLYASLGYREFRILDKDDSLFSSNLSLFVKASYYILPPFLLTVSYHRPDLSPSSPLEIENYLRVGISIAGECTVLLGGEYEVFTDSWMVRLNLLNFPWAANEEGLDVGCIRRTDIGRGPPQFPFEERDMEIGPKPPS